MKIAFNKNEARRMKKRGMIPFTEFLSRMHFSQYVYVIVASAVIILSLIFFMNMSYDIIINFTITDKWNTLFRVVVWCSSVIGFIELFLNQWILFLTNKRTLVFFHVPTHLKRKKYEKS